MNKSKLEDTSKELAMKLYSGLPDEFEIKLNKEKDINILKELWLIVFQRNQDKLTKLVEKRIKSLGGNVR